MEEMNKTDPDFSLCQNDTNSDQVNWSFRLLCLNDLLGERIYKLQ